jgi:pimeloyl-ACP methyl ester carboxylesterase
MITIHCISGLGADERVFQRLTIPGVHFRYVPWPYLDKHDEMACYAQKIAALIPQGPDDHILGLSFGGMLASEIALMRPAQKVFLVSSCKSPDELPEVSPILRFIGRNKLMPVGIATLPVKTLLNLFGAKTEEEKKLIRSILEDSDPHFVRCAFKVILEWKMRVWPRADLVHIHGTDDKVIPPDRVRPTHWVAGGGHFMIFSQAAEVSGLIARHL